MKAKLKMLIKDVVVKLRIIGLPALVISTFFITATTAQELIRQIPAPLPVLALSGAPGEGTARAQYQRIWLTITNRGKYSSEMFALPIGKRLPPNPCSEMKSRVVITIYSQRGDLLSGCIPMIGPESLGKFALLVQRGKAIPEFVYVVVNDRYTGAAYRSNLVSPRSGATR